MGNVVEAIVDKRSYKRKNKMRTTFKCGELTLSFHGESENMSVKLVREKNGFQEKTEMKLMEGEKGIVLEGTKRGNEEINYSSNGIQVEEQKEAIADFGLGWMDRLVDEPQEDIDDMEQGDDEVEEKIEDPVDTLKQVFELSEFVDLIKTFLAGEI